MFIYIDVALSKMSKILWIFKQLRDCSVGGRGGEVLISNDTVLIVGSHLLKNPARYIIIFIWLVFQTFQEKLMSIFLQ